MDGDGDRAEALRPHESRAQRYDRNWIELLQELRVMQTGTQILTGFLLALAFQPAFADLNDRQRAVYLALVMLSAASAVIALAPVALHRTLFRGGRKGEIVRFGHLALMGSLVVVSAMLVGVVGFVFDVVLGGQAGWIAAGGLTALLFVLWAVLPIVLKLVRAGEPEDDEEGTVG
jgi:hypothetical protein